MHTHLAAVLRRAIRGPVYAVSATEHAGRRADGAYVHRWCGGLRKSEFRECRLHYGDVGGGRDVRCTKRAYAVALILIYPRSYVTPLPISGSSTLASTFFNCGASLWPILPASESPAY